MCPGIVTARIQNKPISDVPCRRSARAVVSSFLQIPCVLPCCAVVALHRRNVGHLLGTAFATSFHPTTKASIRRIRNRSVSSSAVRGHVFHLHPAESHAPAPNRARHKRRHTGQVCNRRPR